MGSEKSGKIRKTNIYSIKNQLSSVYFINTNNGYIMVDSGSSAKELKNSLKESKINAKDVKWILITHTDYDHVASLPLFSNGKIYMSEDELSLINGSIYRNHLIFLKNRLPSGIKLDEINLLENGKELSFGDTKVKCIKVPGHTKGSMAYLIEEKYLFTGDALKIHRGKISTHPFSMNMKLSKKSMKKLKEIINEDFIVLTSHYGYHKGHKLN
jgi:glyoxylase-like metal-dependent hydrolase (beta-lactamase superfamily II)